MPQAAIEFNDLAITLDGQKIFSGLNLTIAEQQKVSLIGRSGSGKSTLVRCLLGFMVPTAGTIKIFSEELSAKSIWKLRTRMAYVPQEPELSGGRVQQVLEMPFTFTNNCNLRANLSKIPSLMECLLLPAKLLEEDISELSGGEKQRIAMLMALLLDREIMVLDEASSALDPDSKQAVIDVLQNQKNLTVLSVSHDQEWLAISDRIVDLVELQKGGRQ